MEHVRISEKGKAILRNRQLSIAIVKAIIEDEDKGEMYSRNGLKVKFGSKSVTIKYAQNKQQ